MKKSDLVELLASTLATLHTLGNLLEDEELINDRKMLSDVWRDVVIYGVQRGCNDKIASLLLQMGETISDQTTELNKISDLIKRMESDIENIPKEIVKNEIAVKILRGEPLIEVDIT